MVDPSMNGGQVEGEAVAVEGEAIAVERGGVHTTYLEPHQWLGRQH